MKKVLLAGAALMLVSGIASTASAAAVTPGVVITGDARARVWYKSEEYRDSFGNTGHTLNGSAVADYDSQTDMDTRVRFDITGTAAGGAYAKARIRLMESRMGDIDTDALGPNLLPQSNIWADKAYFGIPFNDMVTVEIGKYRSTYGPMGATYNFAYDDVNLTGIRGIIKVGDIEINPFVEWMDEGVDSGITQDKNQDNDEIRFGAHAKAKLNKDWTVGGMLGYQIDERTQRTGNAVGSGTAVDPSLDMNEPNRGAFGSIYVNGKSGAFGLIGELAFTAADLNGFNRWAEDSNYTTRTVASTTTGLTSTQTYGDADSIGSNDTGFGGYVFPNYTIDKLNIGLNLGFTANGYMPDKAFGFVMIGTYDNSALSAQVLGDTGDWLWAGLVANYTISENLKLTGNLVYADIDPWTKAGDGPGFGASKVAAGNTTVALDSAWELSGVLQYTISKGMNVFFSAGYLKPNLTYINPAITAPLNDDAAFGALTRFELAF